MRHELCVTNNLVFRGSRLVVPVTLRRTMVTLAHENHQGIVRTKQRLRELYWFPGIDAMVQTQIAACSLCQESDRTAKTTASPLQPVPLPDGPWLKLGLDIVGPFETAVHDCKYAITLTDYYSKWPEVAFTPSITTAVVIGFLNSVFSRHGNPECLVTDNGPQLISSAFTAFLDERNIAHTKTSLYHPAANGAVEGSTRFLRTVCKWPFCKNNRGNKQSWTFCKRTVLLHMQ